MINIEFSDMKKKRKFGSQRFLTLDIARGAAILGMFILHIISDTLNIDALIGDINNIPSINILALIILPFLGGLAGFFLLVSSVGNMISFYRQLKRGQPVKAVVLKQIISGVVLLALAMIVEGVTGYHGLFGEVFKHLNDPSAINVTVPLYRWNYFETIHTIAWCLIINGLVQGLLSLKGHWKKYRNLIISYAILAVVVLFATYPVWLLVSKAIPGYPFARYPNGHEITQPWIGTEPFWHIFRAPFVTALASPWEPIFPYLALSFIGSIIGICLSKPAEEQDKNFPRKMFLVGTAMFVGGLVGIALVFMQVLGGTYSEGLDPFLDIVLALYRNISNHRIWTSDAATVIVGGETLPIPRFAYVPQFLALNGFSIMILMFSFRMIEFRGKGDVFAHRTKIIRRFGTVALTNYNNQWLYHLVFFLISLGLTTIPYQRVSWGGTFLIIFITILILSLWLWGWEKIRYIGSFKWFLLTISNNVIPYRRESFPEGTKWWQRGQVDTDKTFYNANWINLDPSYTAAQKDSMIDEEFGEPADKLVSWEDEVNSKSRVLKLRESNLALILSIVGLFSVLFIFVSIFGLIVSINARKTEGKNKRNTAAFVMSIIGCVLIVGIVITTLILPGGALGIF